jgi:hypothetical protein
MAQLWHFQTDGSDQPLFKPTVLICFAIQASGFSIFKLHFPPRKSFGAKDLTMRGFHRSMVEIPSGLQTLEKSNLKPPLPSVLLPRARDLMMRGSCRSTTEILSGLQDFRKLKTQTRLSLKVHGFLPCVPADGWSRFSSGLRHFELKD